MGRIVLIGFAGWGAFLTAGMSLWYAWTNFWRTEESDSDDDYY